MDWKATESAPLKPTGNQSSFLDLIEQNQRFILKICWAYTRTADDRDDLFQEILTRLWQAFDGYDRKRPFSTWMYRVSLNLAIDYRRRCQYRQKESQTQDKKYDPPDRADLSKHDQLQELHERLEDLNETDRAILLLTLEGHRYREIAEIIGTSESNIGTRLNRLKQTLRQSVAAAKP